MSSRPAFTGRAFFLIPACPAWAGMVQLNDKFPLSGLPPDGGRRFGYRRQGPAKFAEASVWKPLSTWLLVPA
jgi:hypothetical protein